MIEDGANVRVGADVTDYSWGCRGRVTAVFPNSPWPYGVSMETGCYARFAADQVEEVRD